MWPCLASWFLPLAAVAAPSTPQAAVVASLADDDADGAEMQDEDLSSTKRAHGLRSTDDAAWHAQIRDSPPDKVPVCQFVWHLPHFEKLTAPRNLNQLQTLSSAVLFWCVFRRERRRLKIAIPAEIITDLT